MILDKYRNTQVFKAPLRATKAPADFQGVRFPCWGTPKLDGLRTLTQPDASSPQGFQALSRAFKPIPNRKWKAKLEETLISKLDGETWMPDTAFGLIDSAFTSFEHPATDDLRYAIFDWAYDFNAPYLKRMWALANLKLPAYCLKILPVRLENMRELVRYEEKCFKDNFEGIMLRSPDGIYKCGQSTFREQYLTKVKRFIDSEAKCIGSTELMHNDNEATTDNLGRTSRSSHKANLRAGGMLGNLICQTPEGIEFRIGSGFTKQQRIDLWKIRTTLKGMVVTYSHQPFGVKEKPRFPKFLRFRNKVDII